MNLHGSSWSWDGLAYRSQALLPAADNVIGLRHLAWSLVLAAMALLLAETWRKRLSTSDASGKSGPGSLAIALLLMAWAWVPGPWGCAYWLSLAFQTPSGVSVLLAGTLLMRVCHERLRLPARALWARVGLLGPPTEWTRVYVGAGVLVGWLLLFDTFALFPVSVYAWGFKPAALALVVGLALLPWVLAGAAARRSLGLVQVWAALALFGLGRWPSGNLWDALLDPWLWVLLNGYLLRGLARRWRV